MIIESQAVEVAGKETEVATKVEILCPACGRDVDQSELDAQKCNDCGADLSNPQQNVLLHATSIPLFLYTFGE